MAYKRTLPFNDLPDLPARLGEGVQNQLLQHTLQAARSLGELKGLCETMDRNTLLSLLVNTLILQESRDSSAIENIVTTQDELYKAISDNPSFAGSGAKEVLNYREALYAGLEMMLARKNLITTNLMVRVVQTIKQNKAGIRAQPGTALKNAITGEVMYTPPCCGAILREKLARLEQFINDPDYSRLDPIIKMGMMHYQFESIHPFADGNGRAGRILNALYLVQQNLLPQPLLYLSAYIAKYKQDYYRLLREVTEQNNWTDWLQFMTTAVNETAQLTSSKINQILRLKKDMKPSIMHALAQYNKRQELFELMFTMPYLKIAILENKELAHRQTAGLYLKKLVKARILQAKKLGRSTYYVNTKLMEVLGRPMK